MKVKHSGTKVSTIQNVSISRKCTGSTITPKCIPSKQNVEMFWKGIQNNDWSDNFKSADWMKELERNYCLNAKQKLFETDKKTIDKLIKKLKPNKATGKEKWQLDIGINNWSFKYQIKQDYATQRYLMIKGYQFGFQPSKPSGYQRIQIHTNILQRNIDRYHYST